MRYFHAAVSGADVVHPVCRREKLRSVIVRDSAEVLGIAAEDLAVTDVTISGATLLSRVALDVRSVEGIAEEVPSSFSALCDARF